METIFVFGQIVSLVLLCCGAALSLFAAITGYSGKSGPRYHSE
jgi:hypothetical protein